MNYLLNSREMKEADNHTIQQIGVPSMVLMERAALGVVDVIRSLGLMGASFGVVCGTGNNGGDGLAVARLLHEAGCSVRYLVVGDEKKGTPDFQTQLTIAKNYGVLRAADAEELDGCDVCIDAMFGIGLSRDIEGEYRRVIQRMEAMEGRKIAVDIPSGVCGDDGSVCGVAVHCQDTVTFAYGKLGCFLEPGREYCGQVHIIDIGITDRSFLERYPRRFFLQPSDICRIPARAQDAHKGDCGRTLIIAGSKGMCGAAYFSGRSACLGGSGLVRIVTPECNRPILQGLLPESVIVPFEGEMEEPQLEELMRWADVILIGPGLGISEASRRLVRTVLQKGTAPLVCDADALNLLSEDLSLLKHYRGRAVVTPHVGEMSRLCGRPISEIRSRCLETAEAFAEQTHAVCVLKGASTVTAVPGGGTYINTSGNPGMATAGSGDVLAGLIAGLMGQGLEPEAAAPLGVYIHGLAGDAAAAQRGTLAMTATDMMDGISEVLKERGR